LKTEEDDSESVIPETKGKEARKDSKYFSNKFSVVFHGDIVYNLRFG
jgi:hypothetical protein